MSHCRRLWDFSPAAEQCELVLFVSKPRCSTPLPRSLARRCLKAALTSCSRLSGPWLKAESDKRAVLSPEGDVPAGSCTSRGEKQILASGGEPLAALLPPAKNNSRIPVPSCRVPQEITAPRLASPVERLLQRRWGPRHSFRAAGQQPADYRLHCLFISFFFFSLKITRRKAKSQALSKPRACSAPPRPGEQVRALCASGARPSRRPRAGSGMPWPASPCLIPFPSKTQLFGPLRLFSSAWGQRWDKQCLWQGGAHPSLVPGVLGTPASPLGRMLRTSGGKAARRKAGWLLNKASFRLPEQEGAVRPPVFAGRGLEFVKATF